MKVSRKYRAELLRKDVNQMFRSAIVTIILLSYTFTFSENTPDFRGFFWGDSLTIVKSTEKAKFLDEKEINESKVIRLRYEGVVQDYNGKIIYFFKDNKLFKAVYLLEKVVTSLAGYINMSNTFKNSLTNKYGKPINEQKSIAGKRTVTWKTNSTLISLEFTYSNTNYLNMLIINYKDNKQVSQDL